MEVIFGMVKAAHSHAFNHNSTSLWLALAGHLLHIGVKWNSAEISATESMFFLLQHVSNILATKGKMFSYLQLLWSTGLRFVFVARTL